MINKRVMGHGRVNQTLHYITEDLKSRYRIQCRWGELFDSPDEGLTIDLWVKHKAKIFAARGKRS